MHGDASLVSSSARDIEHVLSHVTAAPFHALTNPNLNDTYCDINYSTYPLDPIEWKPERNKLFVSVS